MGGILRYAPLEVLVKNFVFHRGYTGHLIKVPPVIIVKNIDKRQTSNGV